MTFSKNNYGHVVTNSLLRAPKSHFKSLLDEIQWQKTSPVRSEYFVSKYTQPYTYLANGVLREYQPMTTTNNLEVIWYLVESRLGTTFDMCFLNRYDNGTESIGWHSDDNKENDDSAPIAIVSLGETRQIQFREKGKEEIVETIDLLDNSLFVMPEFSQHHYQHRIVKAPEITGARISLTFRGIKF